MKSNRVNENVFFVCLVRMKLSKQEMVGGIIFFNN